MSLQNIFVPVVCIHSKGAVARKCKFRAEYAAIQCQSLIKPGFFGSVISTCQNNLLRLDKIGLHISDYIKYKVEEGQGESEHAILFPLFQMCPRSVEVVSPYFTGCILV